VRKSLAAGLVLTLVVTAILSTVFGGVAVLPGLFSGLLATVLQVFAVRALQRGFGGSHTEFARGFVTGTALRLAGIVLVLLAVLLDRGRFAPLPTAFGYLGVVVPLLFLEVRFLR
jgi:hypothetical protein